MKNRRISTYIILIMLTCSMVIPSFMGMPNQEPLNVELIDQLPMTYPNTHKVTTARGYGYVLSYQDDPSEGALDIIDLGSSPPAIVGSCLEFTFPTDVFVDGDYAYVVDQDSANRYYIYQIDVHDPTSPEFTEDYLMFSNVPSQMSFIVTSHESYMYIYHCQTLQDYRLSVYALPSLTQEASSSLSILSEHMTIQDHLVYMVGYSYEAMDCVLEIYNVTDVTSPERTSQIPCMDGHQDINVVNISGVGKYCYLPGEECLEIFDVTDPYQLSESTLFPMGSSPLSIAADRMFLYVSFGAEGLCIYNIGEPERGCARFPPLSGSIVTPGSAVSLDVVDRMMYIADGEDGLCIAQFLYIGTPQPPTGLSFGPVDNSYDFQMTIPESLEGDVHVLWHWGDGTTLDLGAFIAGEIVTATHTWSFEGDYPIKVKLIAQAESLWSKPLIFTADDPTCWTRVAHDFRNTGETSGDAPEKLAISWSKIPEVSASPTAPIVYMNNIYSATFFSYIYEPWSCPLYGTNIVCYNATTGAQEWNFITEERDALYTEPVIQNGLLYFILGTINKIGASFDHMWLEPTLYCLDPFNGTIIWNRSHSYGEEHSFCPHIHTFTHMSCPLIYDGTMYAFMSEKYIDEQHFQRSPKYLCCFNASNGDILWKYRTRSIAGNSPVAYNNRLFFASNYQGFDAGKVVCVDPCGDGQGGTYEYWSYVTPGFDETIASDVVLSDGKVYFSTTLGQLYCLDAKDGSFLWNAPINNGGPVSAGYGNVYVGCGGGLTCIDAASGGLMWQFPIASDLASRASLADGKVYFGTSDVFAENCSFYCLDAESGVELWQYWQGGNVKKSPAIADGYVYVFITTLYGPSILYRFGGPTHPPEKPFKPVGLQEVKRGESYVFSTGSTDLDGSPIQYGWDWDGDLQVDEWTDFYTTRPQSPPIETTHSWSMVGTIQVRVKARDAYDEGEWSDPLDVHIIESGLSIASISGGLRLKVAIANEDEVDVNDIPASISFTGGFVFIPRGGLIEQTINIPAGGKTDVKTFVVGFGRTTINVTLGDASNPLDERSIEAFLLGFFIFCPE